MKAVFFYTLRVLRNLIILLVLFILGVSVGIFFDEEIYTLAERTLPRDLMFEQENTSYATGIMSFPPKSEESAQGTSADQRARIIESSIQQNRAAKIRLKVVGGTLYIRPTQVAYIRTLAGSKRGCMIATTTTLTHTTRQPLAALLESLSKSEDECFFKTKDIIFNCNYIQAITSERSARGNYQYNVLMEDNTLLPIAESKATELRQRLDSMYTQ